MSQAEAQTPTAKAATPSFKNRYKLQGMIAAVVLMWLDFAYLYNGLVNNDPATIMVGMVVMAAAAVAAYYFG